MSHSMLEGEVGSPISDAFEFNGDKTLRESSILCGAPIGHDHSIPRLTLPPCNSGGEHFLFVRGYGGTNLDQVSNHFLCV